MKNLLLELGSNIHMFVETGGPSGGKTSGIAYISRKCADLGYKVLVKCESATKLISGGMTPGELPWIQFQEEILLDILADEERMVSIGKRYRDKGHKVIIICDRGAMDGEAYVDPKDFAYLIKKHGYTDRELCGDRYHAVFHLRTAALGAEKFYTLENNAARYEKDLDVARALDERTLQAWLRHPHPRVIDNSTDFEGKMRRLFAEVCGVLGEPVPLEVEEKFLIESVDPEKFPVKIHRSTVVQDYLVSPDPNEELRVRLRSDNGGTSYYYTSKRTIERGIRAERERIISEREYLTLLSLRDLHCKTIRKERVCFFWKDQFFEVDIFENPQGLFTMEIELTDRKAKIEIPPFIKVIKEVTGDERYSNRELARIEHSMCMHE